MKVTLTIETAPASCPDEIQIQRDVARNLIEATATAVSSGETKGEIKHRFGTATFEVTPDAKAAK